jgi:lipid II:glycine glycyltransferase (peptidoglycan interpeptide bridge formation enzyme)
MPPRKCTPKSGAVNGTITGILLPESRGRHKKETIRYDKRTNEPVTKVVTRTCAVINPAFIKEHNLSKRTKPHKFANIFLPLKNKIKTGAGSFSFHKMMQWTHTRAVFADAGNSYYKNEYDPFSIDQKFESYSRVTNRSSQMSDLVD